MKKYKVTIKSPQRDSLATIHALDFGEALSQASKLADKFSLLWNERNIGYTVKQAGEEK